MERIIFSPLLNKTFITLDFTKDAVWGNAYFSEKTKQTITDCEVYTIESGGEHSIDAGVFTVVTKNQRVTRLLNEKQQQQNNLDSLKSKLNLTDEEIKILI